MLQMLEKIDVFLLTYISGGGSAVSGMDGITLTDRGVGGSSHHVTRQRRTLTGQKNLWNFKIIKFDSMHYYFIITINKRLPAKIRGNNQPDT